MRILAAQDNRRLLIKLSAGALLFILLSFLLPVGPAAAPLLALLFSSAVLIGVWRYLRRQDRIFAAAAERVRAFSQGEAAAQIACDGEGELCYLLHQVNTLAAVAAARAEREQQLNAGLKATVSDISHQLKTPLAALSIHNSLICEAEDLATVRHFCAASERELDRIDRLVMDILKLARLDAGAITFNKQPENMLELMDDLRQRFLCRAQLEGKEIVLSGSADVSFYCDRTWLTEALGNLVKNALDHTGAGGRVSVSWQSSGSLLTLKVADNGSGIHPEDLDHIFERFYRSRFSRDSQGCGLGLPLARHLIEAHGGTVGVESQLQHGTVFTINFVQPTKL